jgi:hypothetical protein
MTSTYDSDTTISEWEGFDFTNHTDRSLITDISRTLTNMSSENRAKLRKQKLRKDLVREHFGDQQRPTSHLRSIFLKLFN